MEPASACALPGHRGSQRPVGPGSGVLQFDPRRGERVKDLVRAHIVTAGGSLHSTSWRFAAGQIVLTYAALPDPDPSTAAVLHPPHEPARGADPLTPSPPQVDQADVAGSPRS